MFSDAAEFIVSDKEKEKQFGFNLFNSLNKATRTGGMLQGYKIHVTKSVKPEPVHMKGITKLSPFVVVQKLLLLYYYNNESKSLMVLILIYTKRFNNLEIYSFVEIIASAGGEVSSNYTIII